MIISYEPIGRCIWHCDCPENRFNSGIMREIKNEPENKRTLMTCLHCGQTGYYPYGKVGQVCCEEFVLSFEDCKPISRDLYDRIMILTKGVTIDLDKPLNPDDD